ncbi:MAG: hypothetical protein NT105_21290 [Verrucomicrobia bacterium]|nr:hypothetical protein [Verrucomicrobiota bacterium]
MNSYTRWLSQLLPVVGFAVVLSAADNASPRGAVLHLDFARGTEGVAADARREAGHGQLRGRD